MNKQHVCIVCSASATTMRTWIPYQASSVFQRIGWLCSEHVAVSREQFHAAMLAHPDNADVRRYVESNREQYEKDMQAQYGDDWRDALAKMQEPHAPLTDKQRQALAKGRGRRAKNGVPDSNSPMNLPPETPNRYPEALSASSEALLAQKQQQRGGDAT